MIRSTFQVLDKLSLFFEVVLVRLHNCSVKMSFKEVPAPADILNDCLEEGKLFLPIFY
jgi:hypothetical protein